MHFSRCKNNRKKKNLKKRQSVCLVTNLGEHTCRVGPYSTQTLTYLNAKFRSIPGN